jgi:SHS2 domain-containing protein
VTYQYLPEIAVADVAFLAQGATLSDLFTAAGDATMNVMVDDLAAIRERQAVEVTLSHRDVDMLLFDFLNEFIYFKDARQLLLRARDVTVVKKDGLYNLRATLYGEKLDAQIHPLKVDVKAVTLHRFEVRETSGGWEATVVLDI